MTWRERLKAFFKELPIWLALLGPVLLLASVIVTAVLDFRFLHMEASWQAIMLGLAPTIVMGGLLLLGRFVRVDYCVLLSFALLGLVYSMTIGMFFTAFSMEFYSQTEDIAHYRQVDELLTGPKRRKPSSPNNPAMMGDTTIIAAMTGISPSVQNGRSRRRSWKPRSPGSRRCCPGRRDINRLSMEAIYATPSKVAGIPVMRPSS